MVAKDLLITRGVFDCSCCKFSDVNIESNALRLIDDCETFKPFLDQTRAPPQVGAGLNLVPTSLDGPTHTFLYLEPLARRYLSL